MFNLIILLFLYAFYQNTAQRGCSREHIQMTFPTLSWILKFLHLMVPQYGARPRGAVGWGSDLRARGPGYDT